MCGIKKVLGHNCKPLNTLVILRFNLKLHFQPPSTLGISRGLPSKRKKTPGLTRLELKMAYKSLVDSLKTVTATNKTITSDDPQEDLDSDFEEAISDLLQMMRSKLKYARLHHRP